MKTLIPAFALLLAALTGALLSSLSHAGDYQAGYIAGYAAGLVAPRAEDAPFKDALCRYATAACGGVK